jgi:hypothetical protein
VDLDRLFDRSKIAGNLLVETSSDNVRKHFAFARRLGRNFRPNRSHFGVNSARFGILLFGSRYGFEQVAVVHRFRQKIDGARLHCADARWNVALPSHEYDRPMRPAGCQRLLQFDVPLGAKNPFRAE